MKFKAFTNYLCRFVSNHDSTFVVEIVGRTEKFVKFKVPNIFGNEVKRKKIDTYNGHETFFPLGVYSMAPVCHSTKIIED